MLLCVLGWGGVYDDLGWEVVGWVGWYIFGSDVWCCCVCKWLCWVVGEDGGFYRLVFGIGCLFFYCDLFLFVCLLLVVG